VSTAPFQLQSVAELEARVHAESSGTPFLVFRDGAGRQQLVALPDDSDRVVIGRSPQQGIHLAWDKEVSRLHAMVERVAGAWTIVDDGMSSNGTFVGGIRLCGRRRLCDGDVIQCGGVTLEFRDASAAPGDETIKAAETPPSAARLSPQQRRVLIALCRPLSDGQHRVPATNKAIAAELQLSVDAVKTHLRRAAETLNVDGLRQNEKRATLAWTALRCGAVTPRDLVADG
jgi:pSer/pThr/pTyr-binding forkhead associated (FHA) protein